jgi:hypothetical protein
MNQKQFFEILDIVDWDREKAKKIFDIMEKVTPLPIPTYPIWTIPYISQKLSPECLYERSLYFN